MLPQEAVEAPRVATYAFPGSSHPYDYFPHRLNVEGRIPEDVRNVLSARGHEVRVWPERTWLAGCVAVVHRDPTRGMIMAAADPRRPAAAIAH
jgi:gamma-glutamyltranspeptidase/glutathione hydrolase